MKTEKNFGHYLSIFFTKYLSDEIGVSYHTVRSYRDCFKSFLDFMDKERHLKSDHIQLSDINRANVLDYLNWIQEKYKVSSRTRNQRLAAFRSFAKFMQYEDIIHLGQWQDIGRIPMKKAEKKAINYLTIEGIKFLLSQIPTDTERGRRDLVLLSLLYDSAARVQELADLTPADLHLKAPCYIKLFGKGQKARIVPIQREPAALLRLYVEKHAQAFDAYGRTPLFFNRSGKKLTTAGISYILSCYVKIAHQKAPELVPEKLSPHCLRHSKAMHLLQAGVNLVYIRDILGHSTTEVTEVYARADTKQKRMALENAYQDVVPSPEDIKLPTWEKDSKLREWLKSLGK
jgi:site-specific recombinase XerD